MPRSGHGHHGYQVGGRDSIGAFLHPTNGYRGSLAKRGVRPKDHARANFAALKAAQADNRAKKEAQAAAAGTKQQYKLARFRNIPGRAMSSTAKMAEAATGKENGATGGSTFMRKGQGRRASAAAPSPPNMKQKQSAWSPGALPPSEEYIPQSRRNLAGRNKKAAVPRAKDAAPKREHRPVDFVAANNKSAVDMKAGARASANKSGKGVAKPPQRHKHGAFGRVPSYLQDRKQQWAAEEEKRRIEAGDPDCPAGMRTMSEADRLETLEALKKSEAEGKRQLMKLPLRVETASQVKKKAELEGKMKEIEEAIVIFSRQKVFINKD